MRCQGCGAANGFRRACHLCGAGFPLRALLRRLFAADPDGADGPDLPRRPDLAPPRARLIAAAIDVSLMATALVWVGGVGFDPAFGNGGPPLRVRFLAWVVVLGHTVLLEGMSGQTLGKRVVGIRVVSVVSGQPIGLGAAAHRAGARAAFWFVSFLALADPLYQTLHDRSAGTIVLSDPVPVRHPQDTRTGIG